MGGWFSKKVIERERRVKWPSLCVRRAARNSFLSFFTAFTNFSSFELLPAPSTCPPSFDLLPLFPFSSFEEPRNEYFSSIHCAVVMTTTILDNLPPLRTCPPLYQAILFLISTRPRFLTVKSVYTGWKYHKYHPRNHRYRDNYGEIWIL